MAEFEFKLVASDKKTRARSGVIKTPHGKIETPAFSPVATRASVRSLSNDDLKNANSQVVLGNTYHLYLKPGTSMISKFGGFGPFMGWDGPTITDSGGYQVSFLWSKGNDEDKPRVIKIDDKGALFRSHLDGSLHLLTPEKSMEIQKILGADIIMAFDQPQGLNMSPRRSKEAFERTFLWEERSLKTWQKLNKKGNFQALYGIVQGDLDKELRKKSLDFVLKNGFLGIAIGGEAIGSDPKTTSLALDTIADYLPDDLPVHALGLGGGPEGIFEAVRRGVDTFDNTGITRMARTGLLFIYPEDGGNRKNKFRIDIKKKEFADKKGPVSKVCTCYTCQNFSKAYIHHLLTSGEVLGLRLATIHNVFFINDLMARIRKSIMMGDFEDLTQFWLR
ncbi:MAG: queuine tRNA-ribosyltransferase [Patescibacteria group bacterium]|nr:MAG: queuine tRNA-ribosyltransferase [Patescibacteria group bacterium]